MPGLRNNADQPAGAPPAGGSPPAGGPTEFQSEVSPEEQQQYDQFVTAAMTMMNKKETADKLLKAIESGESPINGLANAVASIVMRVEDTAIKAGDQISGDVLMHGGIEILEQAADLSEQAGGHAFTEQELEKASYIAMDLYREGRGDKIDQAEQGESLQELQAAEADGSLEQQVPGLAEHGRKNQAPLEGEVIPAGSGPQQG